MEWKSAHYPISDIRDWRNDEKLEIRPDFQRKEVWSMAAKIMLIDTILKNIPMPKIYLEAIIQDNKTYRIVIDGQQRLTAIFDFLDDKLVLNKPYEGSLYGKKYSELSKDEQKKILGYEIDFNALENATEEDVRSLYSRVNKYTVQLNKQELRKADFPGEFISLAEELVENSFFERGRVFSAKMTRRMLDVEFIEELLCVLLDGIQDKKKSIDMFCEEYKKFEQGKDNVRDQFIGILADIEKIYDEKEGMDFSKSRFRQRSDLYGLFAVISDLKKNGMVLDCDKLKDLREELQELNEGIEPMSEITEYREYAIHCTSDANSLTSRKWRYDFLYKYLERAYKKYGKEI